jgi:hypothetical protein
VAHHVPGRLRGVGAGESGEREGDREECCEHGGTLGHSTVVPTMDTYSHALPTMQAQAAETTERLLKG